MFEGLFADYYWSSAIGSLSKLPKEAIIGGAAALAAVQMHKQHCNMKVKVAEAEARKAEAEAELAKIQTFTVKD